jgi:type IV pilus assembly protein PilY1
MYALDVTANVTSTSGTVVPKFLWRIQGGTGSYARMGQTWSQPQLTKISISDGSGGTTTKDVLVFGGGYDTALDDKNVYDPSDNSNNDFLGNAIYIADPTDGSVIMDISGAGSGADIIVSDMQYSIPSRVRLMDSNGDGLTDRLYVGDTGGQVWRVDLDPEIAAGNEADTVIAKLADVSTATNQRRFFEPPAVVQVRDTVYSDTSEYDYVLIGSGYRAHPLNTDVKDRFYAFRDRTITTFGLPDGDSDNVSEASDNYPQTGGTAYADGDLVDVTTSALDATDASDLAADGWFYDFTTAGSSAEKVLSAATVTSGAVVFTTFKPNTISITDPCQGGVGNATAYNLDILSANAALDWDGDGDIDLADRALALGGGIPSDVVPIFTEEGVVGIVGIEGGASQLGVLAGLPRFRTYWYEE